MAYELEPVAAPTAPGNPDNGRFGVRSEEIFIDHKPPSRVTSKGAAPSAETKEAPPVETGSGTSLSAGAVALARKEQAFRREQLALKQKLEASEAALKELEELRAFKKKLEAKDFSELEKLAPYDEYTDYHINKLNGTSPEQEAIKEVKSQIDALQKERAVESEKAKQQAIEVRKKAVSDIVEKSPDFSSIRELKMQDAVVQHMVESWEKDGVELSAEDACKEVETELIEQGKIWTGLSKLKAAPVIEESKNKPLPPLKQSVSTLTNSMAATGEISRPKKSYANMSETERYKAALQRVQEMREAGQRKA